jgi:hypothetical protein
LLIGKESGEVKSATDENGQAINAPPATKEFESIESDVLVEGEEPKYIPEVGIEVSRNVVSGYVVTVSQQPLTEEQRKDPEEFLSTISVAELAGGSIETNKGRAYIVAPTDDFPSQRVMFIVKDSLVLVQTPGVSIEDEAWADFINSIE